MGKVVKQIHLSHKGHFLGKTKPGRLMSGVSYYHSSSGVGLDEPPNRKVAPDTNVSPQML